MRVKATDLQNAFGKYLALSEKEDIIIVKNGKVVAKLIHHSEPDYFIVYEEARQYGPPKRISYEEYLDLVNSSDQRYELIDGEVYLLASPSFRHQVVVNEIAGHFYNYFKGKPCQPLTAPLDIRLFGLAIKFEENPNVVQPDIVVICDEENVNEDNKYMGVPTLIVEVLSSSTKGKDMAAKLSLYMKSGVREYWIVDLEKKNIYQYTFSDERDITGLNAFREGDTITSPVFLGLKIGIDDVFQ